MERTDGLAFQLYDHYLQWWLFHWPFNIRSRKQAEILYNNIPVFRNVPDLKKIISESNLSNTNNNDFLITIIGDSKNENSYSNSKLMEQININNNISEKLKTIYLSNFYLIIDLLDKFFSQ